MRDRCQKFSIFKTWQLKNNLLLGTNNTGKLKEFIFYIKHFNLFSEYKVLNLNEFNNNTINIRASSDGISDKMLEELENF